MLSCFYVLHMKPQRMWQYIRQVAILATAAAAIPNRLSQRIEIHEASGKPRRARARS